jgi:manganese/iron transport system substrate-binding protein
MSHLNQPKHIFKLTAIAIVLGLSGCATTKPPANPIADLEADQASTVQTSSNLQVVATVPILCDLTEQIAAETIELTCLLQVGADPHFYQATPIDAKAVADAEVVFYGGYNYEVGLMKLIETSDRRVPVFELAVPEPLMAQPHEHDHEHSDSEHDQEDAEHDQHDNDIHNHDQAATHSHEEQDHEDLEHKHDGEHDDHGDGHDEHSELLTADPHVWQDAENGIAMVAVIKDELINLSPENASLYEQNAAQLTSELEQIDTWIKAQIATIPPQQRQLITTHQSMRYYAHAYGLTLSGALQGVSSEEQATPSQVKDLIDTIKTMQVPTIFAETTTNPRLLETVAQEAGAKVAAEKLWVGSLGAKGSDVDTYPKMLITNTRIIVEGLGGDYTPLP